MGIVPDLKAIRSVTKVKHKPSSSSRRDYAASSKRDDDQDQDDFYLKNQKKRDALDEKALAEMKKEDLQYMIDSLELDEIEDAIVGDDNGMSGELRRQKMKEAIERCVGKSTLAELAEKGIKNSTTPVLDSDGDLVTTGKEDDDSDLDLGLISSKAAAASTPPEVVYRDQDGHKITRQRWLELQAARKGGYRVKKKDEKKTREPAKVVEWGGGLVQDDLKKLREEEERRIVEQPFARHEIDDVFDKELRETVRWDDPLRHIEKKNVPAQAEGVPVPKPECRFSAPPNRFGIKPGYRWDGCVRGNGYEDKLLKNLNRKQHQEREDAYKWSVEEM